MRSPWAGRNWEGAGEDPFLVGIVAAETVKGIQKNGVVRNLIVLIKHMGYYKGFNPPLDLYQIATAKHFAGNEQETNRNSVSSLADTV
jgi:beta-glucosidase